MFFPRPVLPVFTYPSTTVTALQPPNNICPHIQMHKIPKLWREDLHKRYNDFFSFLHFFLSCSLHGVQYKNFSDHPWPSPLAWSEKTDVWLDLWRFISRYNSCTIVRQLLSHIFYNQLSSRCFKMDGQHASVKSISTFFLLFWLAFCFSYKLTNILHR